jgi:lysophospholipase L1-like esterase
MSSSSATAPPGRLRRALLHAAAWGGGGTLLLLLLELGVRLAFPGIGAQGTDRALVREQAFGAAHGWVPGATGTVFGQDVTIGPDGFRDHHPPAEADSVLLLFGDSVTFGVGVPAESTFAGRLQRRFPRLRVMNTAAIGYTVRDYRAVAGTLLPHTPRIARAVVVFCLNDFSTDRPLEVRAIPALAFLRSYSRLYIVLKHLLADRSRVYFLHDLGFYTGAAPEARTALADLRALVELLAARGIPVTVMIPPYEYQLRAPQPGHFTPQQMAAGALRDAPCSVADLAPLFLGDPNPAGLFLYGDHMHLSSRGHALAAAALTHLLEAPPARP